MIDKEYPQLMVKEVVGVGGGQAWVQLEPQDKEHWWGQHHLLPKCFRKVEDSEWLVCCCGLGERPRMCCVRTGGGWVG